MRESELLSYIYGRSAGLIAPNARVLVGPGDDCAVVETQGASLLLKVDQLVEGRHFTSDTSVDLIARKAIARAVSDVAAMGGTPLVGLCAATLPHGYSHADALFDATLKWSRHFACPLVGGDIASLGAKQVGPLVLGVSIVGRPHEKRGAVLRSGARAGDDLYATGALGNSFASGRHLTFEPRVREGAWLCDVLGDSLHAMMDVSDGLGRDAGRIADSSGVAMEIEAIRVPMHADCSDWRRAVSEGEDYELLFCAAAGARVPERCAPTGVPITRIGRVRAREGGKPACAMITASGERVDAGEMGWEHA